LVRMAKKPSTALSHEAEVGVKWNVQRTFLATVKGMTLQDHERRPGSYVALSASGWSFESINGAA
jgi:hypothetical protein